MSPPRITRIRTRTSDRGLTVAPAVAPVAQAQAQSTPPQLLRLLHLASPALPIGAFHFSQGLEYAVEAGWVPDEASALDWIGGIAQGSIATLDLPILVRLRAAWLCGDAAEVLRWNAFLIACRETEELRLEDRHLGSAMLRVLKELELETDLFVRDAGCVGVAHATSFAFACARWNIEVRPMLETYAWSWAENQVLAAVKLVPLGQSAGQRILYALHDRLAAHAARAIDLTDSDIGISTSLSAVASGRHEVQYTRLFRS